MWGGQLGSCGRSRQMISHTFSWPALSRGSLSSPAGSSDQHPWLFLCQPRMPDTPPSLSTHPVHCYDTVAGAGRLQGRHQGT